MKAEDIKTDNSKVNINLLKENEKLKELIEKLKEYAQHKLECDLYYPASRTYKCSCGLKELVETMAHNS